MTNTLLAVVIVMVILSCLHIAYITNKISQNFYEVAKAHNNLVTSCKQDSAEIRGKLNSLTPPDSEIQKITDRLDAIVKDIERIDRDEKWIRRYYINYREPIEPEENTVELPFPGDINYFTNSEQMEDVTNG
jgi:hypothetical protein